MTRLLAVYDGSDNLLMRFEYADSRMPVAMTTGDVVYYLAYDQVGTLKAVADASGNVVKSIGYDSFGNIISDSNPAFHVPFGFAGGLHDRDTGLVRFGYRDYDPDVGRWTAKDPILFAGGDTDLYGYCVGDPINKVDSLGLDDESEESKNHSIKHISEEELREIIDLVLSFGPGSISKSAKNWISLDEYADWVISMIKKEARNCMRGAAGKGKHMGQHGKWRTEAARRLKEIAKEMEGIKFKEIIDKINKAADRLIEQASGTDHFVQ